MPSRRIVFLLLVLSCCSYLPNIDGEFFYDDINSIVENSYLKSDTPLVDFFAKPGATSGSHFLPYRPLSYYTHKLTYQLGRGSPIPFHIANILIHLLVTLLAFFLCRCLLKAATSQSDANVDRAALFCSLLFAAHPLQAQPVNYACDRAVLLCTLFTFCAVYLYARLITTNSKRAWSYVLIMLSSFLAFTSKEPAILLLPLLLLFDYLLASKGKRRSLRVATIASVFALSLIYLWVRSKTGNVTSNSPDEVRSAFMLSRLDYLLTGVSLFWKYVSQFFWPSNFYIFNEVAPAKGLSDISFVLSLLSLLLLLLFAWLIRKRHVVVTLGISWYLLNLSITSTVFPLYLIYNPNRVYAANFGLSLIVAYLLLNLLNVQSVKRFVWPFAITLVLIGHIKVIEQSFLWRSNLLLISAMHEKAPNSPALNYYYATTLRRTSAMASAQFLEETIERVEQQAKPVYPLDAYRYLAKIYELYATLVAVPQPKKSEAAWLKAVKWDPTEERLWYNFGVFLKQIDNQRAKEAFVMARQLAEEHQNKDILSRLSEQPYTDISN